MRESPEENPRRGADIDEVLTELKELEDIVDRDEELAQVRETIRTARRVRQPNVIGRFHDQFSLRDAGEAVVGSFVFGMPIVVEDGALVIGRHLAERPAALAPTVLLGGFLIYGILHAGEFERVAADRLLGVVPLRLVGILAIAGTMAVVLLTAWGRVSWATPLVAGSQTLLIGIVMGVGASLGDILPER